MRTKSLVLAALATASAVALADDVPLMTHAELQAVDTNGKSTFVVSNSCPFLLRGILLNDPADMLSTDYVPGAEGRGAGAQYQVFVQGLSPDRGGTALYMSEGTTAESYTEEEWASELARLTTDPDTGRPFRPGDYVEVTANWAMGRGGKCNVNEAHDKSPSKDFHIRLLTPDVGLPPAEPITLADLVADDGIQIFDPTRATGGEHWQGMRVRLDAIRLTDDVSAVWNNPDGGDVIGQANGVEADAHALPVFAAGGAGGVENLGLGAVFGEGDEVGEGDGLGGGESGVGGEKADVEIVVGALVVGLVDVAFAAASHGPVGGDFDVVAGAEGAVGV